MRISSWRAPSLRNDWKPTSADRRWVSCQVTATQAAEVAQRDEHVARADLNVAESEIEVAKAQLADARAQLVYETAILEQHTLVAPFDALVVDRQKELGAVIKAGDPIFTLVAVGSIWALAYIDESRSGGITEGQPAEVRLRSLADQVFAARLVRIGIGSDPVSEEWRVKLRQIAMLKLFGTPNRTIVAMIVSRRWRSASPASHSAPS